MKIAGWVIENIFRKYYLTRTVFLVVGDILLITLSWYLAFLLRFDGSISSQYFSVFWRIVFLSLPFYLFLFRFFKLYSFSWSYISTVELIALFKASILALLFLSITLYILQDIPFIKESQRLMLGFPFTSGVPRSILFISYFLIIFFCGGVRFAKKFYSHTSLKDNSKNKERTLIVGAGDAGEQIVRSMLVLEKTNYVPVGFVDDSLGKQNLLIHGLRVLGAIDDIPSLIEKYKVDQMIIALPSAGADAIKKAVAGGRKGGLKKIKIVPSFVDIMNDQVSLKSLREVEVGDLLGRKPVVFDTDSIQSFIKDKKVLVTGAAGSIGSELVRQLAKFKPSSILLLDQDETGIFDISEEVAINFKKQSFISFVADIRDNKRIEKIFEEFRPQVVFHAAAYKHVPLMELHPREAVFNNVFGTEIIARNALKFGAERFIFVSTDKAVKPSSVMGSTKRIGEMLCQSLNQENHTKFISVRFGNVLNSRGSVIPIFKKQIQKGGPVTVTHADMRRYFMVTSEAVLLVLQAGAMGQGGEVFVLDMGEPIKIVDLAKEMIRLSGYEPDKDIPIVFTQPRPGEKFFEDILNAEEGTIATRNAKIFIAKLSQVEKENLERTLGGLRKVIQSQDRAEIIKTLKKIVPLYNPPA